MEFIDMFVSNDLKVGNSRCCFVLCDCSGRSVTFIFRWPASCKFYGQNHKSCPKLLIKSLSSEPHRWCQVHWLLPCRDSYWSVELNVTFNLKRYFGWAKFIESVNMHILIGECWSSKRFFSVYSLRKCSNWL